MPKEMQRAIWRYYRNEQEVDHAPISDEYLEAAMAAIEYIKRTELGMFA